MILLVFLIIFDGFMLCRPLEQREDLLKRLIVNVPIDRVCDRCLARADCTCNHLCVHEDQLLTLAQYLGLDASDAVMQRLSVAILEANVQGYPSLFSRLLLSLFRLQATFFHVMLFLYVHPVIAYSGHWTQLCSPRVPREVSHARHCPNTGHFVF